MEKLRSGFTAIGIASLAAVLFSTLMFFYALSRGIHCPQCDRLELGDSYEAWSSYFNTDFYLLFYGGIAALLSLVLARQRKYALIAIVIAFLRILFMPM